MLCMSATTPPPATAVLLFVKVMLVPADACVPCRCEFRSKFVYVMIPHQNKKLLRDCTFYAHAALLVSVASRMPRRLAVRCMPRYPHTAAYLCIFFHCSRGFVGAAAPHGDAGNVRCFPALRRGDAAEELSAPRSTYWLHRRIHERSLTRTFCPDTLQVLARLGPGRAEERSVHRCLFHSLVSLFSPFRYTQLQFPHHHRRPFYLTKPFACVPLTVVPLAAGRDPA